MVTLNGEVDPRTGKKLLFIEGYVDLKDGTRKTVYLTMNRALYYNLRALRAHAKKYNGDAVIVIDGAEGAGKSTLTRQVAVVLDPRFTEKRIAFNSTDARRMHFQGTAWESIVLDESKEDLDRKGTMSWKNRYFMNFLSQSRQLNKFLLVVLPSIYDLDKYVAEHRAVMLLHVYKHKGRKLGYFSMYGKNGIKRLFLYGFKKRAYNVTPSFSGTFPRTEVVDLERYNKIKRAAIEKYRPKKEEEPQTPEEIVRDYIAERLQHRDKFKEKYKLTMNSLGEIFGVTRRTLYKYLNKDTDEED